MTRDMEKAMQSAKALDAERAKVRKLRGLIAGLLLDYRFKPDGYVISPRAAAVMQKALDDTEAQP